jgi:hypothetical protein
MDEEAGRVEFEMRPKSGSVRMGERSGERMLYDKFDRMYCSKDVFRQMAVPPPASSARPWQTHAHRVRGSHEVAHAA